MKRISQTTTNTLLAQAQSLVAAPYTALAASLAAHAIAESKAVKAVGDEKSSTWGLMKSALKIAADNGHSHEVMRAGLEIACVNADVPDGSFRGYMSTIENLKSDIDSGDLTLADAQKISVADARKRYKPAPTPVQVARDRLLAAIAGRKATNDAPAIPAWTAEHINTLAQIAEDDNAKYLADKEAADAAGAETAVPEQQRRVA